jgi:hypothetical protein
VEPKRLARPPRTFIVIGRLRTIGRNLIFVFGMRGTDQFFVGLAAASAAATQGTGNAGPPISGAVGVLASARQYYRGTRRRREGADVRFPVLLSGHGSVCRRCAPRARSRSGQIHPSPLNFGSWTTPITPHLDNGSSIPQCRPSSASTDPVSGDQSRKAPDAFGGWDIFGTVQP